MKYLFHVKGSRTIPHSSFPYRMGCHDSDMYTISICYDEYFTHGISLSEYHAAFLCSPLFQIELWLLSKISTIDRITTTKDHLQSVALGDHSSFGPWTTWAIEGSRTQSILEASNGTTSLSPKETTTQSKFPCVIMRCRTNRGPFCDTWWALDIEDDPHKHKPHLQMKFGTSLIGIHKSSLMVQILTPFHDLYSRLLLSSCMATLVQRYKPAER